MVTLALRTAWLWMNTTTSSLPITATAEFKCSAPQDSLSANSRRVAMPLLSQWTAKDALLRATTQIIELAFLHRKKKTGEKKIKNKILSEILMNKKVKIN